MTPSNASRSPNFSSVILVQYSSTSLAVPCSTSNFLTCTSSSPIVSPAIASGVISHSCRAETRSSAGAGGGPRRRLVDRERFLPASEPAEPSLALRRETRSEDVREGEWGGGERVEGRTSFFCFEAGRISSRSTGTPRETRKRRRMRDRIQFGGWRGGGATSWDQSEALRGVRKIGFSDVRGGRIEVSIVSGGKRASM